MEKKDKPNKKTSMEDIVKERASQNRKGGHNALIGYTGIEDGKKVTPQLSPGVRQVQLLNSEDDLKQEKDINEYNDKLMNDDIDPLYADLIPTQKVLVRCFCKEVQRTESGLIIPPDEIKVKVPTQSGQGFVETVRSPWAFSTKAKVIAIPTRFGESETQPIQVGKVVQLIGNVIIPRKDGKEMIFHVPAGYTHPSYQMEELPQNIKDQHYGYFLVEPRDIVMILE